MNKNQLSLMTFPMALDILLGRMRVADTLQLAKNAGIPYVDIMGVNQKKRALYQHAVIQTDVHVCCYITSISFFEEKDIVKKRIVHELETAAALQAKMLMIVPYSGGKDLMLARTMDEQAVRKKMIDGFRLAVHMGEQKAIPVCFETTPRPELHLSGTKDCRKVLDSVPGLGLVFDTANMLPAGDAPLEAYEELKNYIVHVHLKDVALKSCNRPPKFAECSHDGKIMTCSVWGTGVIPVGDIYHRMLEDGYHGNFAIEYAHPKGLVCGIERHQEQLQRFLCSTVMQMN